MRADAGDIAGHIRRWEHPLEARDVVGGDGEALDHALPQAHERERATLHSRLIAFAFRCGIRRSVSLSVTLPQTYLTAYRILAGTESDDHPGRATDMHQWGHTYDREPEAHNHFYAWHVETGCVTREEIRASLGLKGKAPGIPAELALPAAQ